MPLGQFCSAECLAARRPTKQAPSRTPLDHPEVRRRDGHCRCCGGRSGLHVHHIVFRSQGGSDEPDNLILLCSECHANKAHGAESWWYRQLFLGYLQVLATERRKLSISEVAARLTVLGEYPGAQ